MRSLNGREARKIAIRIRISENVGLKFVTLLIILVQLQIERQSIGIIIKSHMHMKINSILAISENSMTLIMTKVGQ
jgi:hypothetical protein